MTGRSRRLIRGDQDCNKDRFILDDRKKGRGSQVNMAEKLLFMNKTKRVAILSAAASTGISLQAAKDCANQQRRVHITLELPWGADKAIQQLGRTHRSNQVAFSAS